MSRKTILPNVHFDENLAAEALEKAMRGGKEEKERGVMLLLTANNAQRQMIRTPYKVRYGKDLEEELKKSLKGDLEGIIISLLNTPTKEDVLQLHKAVKGLGTNEKILTEILVSRTNDELEAIRNTYFMNYNKKLEDAISADTSGDFKKLLFSLVQGARDNSIHTDSLKAQKDAEALAKPLEKKLLGGGGDKFEKYRVLATDSFHQLQRVFEEFQRKTGTTLDKMIEKELSGDLQNAVLSLYKIAAHGHARYFADLIHEAFKNKKDDDLVRIFVARSEIDLENIKEVYLSVYGKSLVNAVKEDIKGVSQEALLALLRGNKSFA